MNQWQPIPIQCLCNKHLLGVHGEHHKHAPGFCKGRSIQGYLDNHCIAPATYKQRHDEAETEINRRKKLGEIGGKPINSPLRETPTFEHLSKTDFCFVPDLAYNIAVLAARCDDCAERLWNNGYFI